MDEWPPQYGGGGEQLLNEEGEEECALFSAGLQLEETREVTRSAKGFVEFDRGTLPAPFSRRSRVCDDAGHVGGGWSGDHVVFSYVLVANDTFPDPALAPDPR